MKKLQNTLYWVDVKKGLPFDDKRAKIVLYKNTKGNLAWESAAFNGKDWVKEFTLRTDTGKIIEETAYLRNVQYWSDFPAVALPK